MQVKQEKSKKLKGPLAPVHAFLINVFFVLLGTWVVFGLVFGLKSAPNNDMHPRIDQGDLLLYYRLDKNPSNQDVIVFEKNDTVYVGRVVALPGERVEVVANGGLLVNDRNVIEPDIYFATPPYEGFVKYPLTLKETECFVLVDMRDGGEDSRYFGPVELDAIQGTVLAVLRRNVI